MRYGLLLDDLYIYIYINSKRIHTDVIFSKYTRCDDLYIVREVHTDATFSNDARCFRSRKVFNVHFEKQIARRIFCKL